MTVYLLATSEVLSELSLLCLPGLLSDFLFAFFLFKQKYERKQNYIFFHNQIKIKNKKSSKSDNNYVIHVNVNYIQKYALFNLLQDCQVENQ